MNNFPGIINQASLKQAELTVKENQQIIKK